MQLRDFLDEAIHEISRGTRDKKHPFRYLIFNTLNKHYPDTRMVVSRELETDPLGILVYSDRRSNKVQQLKINAGASLLYWHPTKRLQVKVLVSCEFLSGKERTSRYHSLQSGQESYNTVQSPSSEIDEIKTGHELHEAFNGENFTVIRGLVQEIEVLQLSGKEHLRAKFTFESKGLIESTWLVP